jgi:hypothetical protein
MLSEVDEAVVIKTNKPIGFRVSDVGAGGKEYNVKTDKAYDDAQAKKKLPQGADFAAQRRKERLASNGRMDEEMQVGDKVNFDHPMKAIPGKTMKKVGTVHKVEGDTIHVKVKDKYGVITHKKTASELRKEEVIAQYNEYGKIRLIGIPMLAKVSSGTYIRQLCADIGNKLGIPCIADKIERVGYHFQSSKL